jgi:5'-3' exonuclease
VSILSPKSKSVGGGACYVYLHHSDVLDAVGVPPERFVDFLVLLGDTADGIPGVDGIGAVRAKQILTQYDSINAAMRDFKSHETKRDTALACCFQWASLRCVRFHTASSHICSAR